jgi:pimeloyl-ACP methyl ester carboxylesterase
MKNLIAFVLAILSAILAFVTLRWLTKSREEIDWQDAARPGKMLDVDGVALHYVDAGPAKKPAVVMVHGFGGHTFSFRNQFAAFSSDHRCVAIDLKGFGYSERPDDGDYSLSEQARLMLGAMDRLHVGRATLIGHSMGGAVVMRMAAAAPERVEKLILAASVSGERTPVAPRLPFLRRILPGLSRLMAARAWKNMFYDPSQLDTESIHQAYLGPAHLHGSINTIWQMWEDVPRDPPIDYAAITMPTLILAAEKERIIPLYPLVLNRLQQHLPHAQVATVEHTGHLLLEENPSRANELIRDFLAPPRKAKRREPAATA